MISLPSFWPSYMQAAHKCISEYTAGDPWKSTICDSRYLLKYRRNDIGNPIALFQLPKSRADLFVESVVILVFMRGFRL